MEVNSAHTLEYWTPIFCPENSGNTFVRNFDKELQDYTAWFKFILSPIADMFQYNNNIIISSIITIQPELTETFWPSHVKLQRLVLPSSVFNNQQMHYWFSVTWLLSYSICHWPDVLKATRRLRRSKSAGLDVIAAFIIKDCSDIFNTCS